MKATETQLTKFLNGTKQFLIPIYQRTYRWEKEQCRQLWKDIVKAATDDKIAGHFIGSIVYIEKGLYQPSSPPQLLVIDGHQRLTTISLLLIAMSRRMQEMNIEGEISHRKILNYYLLNSDEDGELKYKLILTRTDKTTLISMIDGTEIREPSSKRIIENYQFFEEQIRKSSIDIGTLYKGIKKLIMVDISLDRTQDNPQRIFESMNSTGMDLTQTDLIRNYVLMGREIPEQQKFYNQYWYPMEQSFGQEEYAELFNRFMRDYLTLKTRDIPTFGGVYEAFKSYTMGTTSESFETVLSDIHKFSKYYVGISREQEQEKELKEIFKDINELRVEVAFPFLLEVYDDYSRGILKLEEFKEILTIIESYVFRRAICGIPTNALNKIFATIGKEIDKNNYLESFKTRLVSMDKYRRFPEDEEFKRNLKAKDLYHFPRRNYWLRKLENYQHKERIIVEDYTIEHIMPQSENLSKEWKSELGPNWKDIHKKYLHSLGNLTLTGYNIELSNRPFSEKRDMKGGFKDSHLRLNADIANLDHWNEQEIENRANRLAELAAEVWPYPDLPQKIIDEIKREQQDDSWGCICRGCPDNPGKKDECPDGCTGKDCPFPECNMPESYCENRVKEMGYRYDSETNLYFPISPYTLADHPHVFEGGAMADLFEQLRKRILNLDASVSEEILKLYIAYKTTTNFVDIIPQKSRLRLTINVKFGELQDPKGLCKDITNKGRWGNGDVEVWLTSADQLDDVMALIKQSFEKHTNYDDQ